MAFIKVVKNRSYFKRFQVAYRRRRECKTDYYARRRLIIQDKNKYKTPKYRLVVRITNRDIITQIVAADLTHDVVIAAAYSHELPRYGIKLGLTNYAAAYATGLLLARRVNARFNLNYEGQAEVNGEMFLVEPEEEGPRPFRALLDVGLARTTTGARVFGVVKGAADGGLNVPHNDHRFPGSKRENGAWTADPETHRRYIFGQHVADYMRQLQEQDEEAYNRQFKRFVDEGVSADDLEGLYTAAHSAIRAEPNKPRSDAERGYFCERTEPRKDSYENKSYHRQKKSLAQRKARIVQKLKARGLEPIPV